MKERRMNILDKYGCLWLTQLMLLGTRQFFACRRFLIMFWGTALLLTAGPMAAGEDQARVSLHDGSATARAPLADRLYNALSQAAQSREHRNPVMPILWKTLDVQFPLRQDEPFTADTQQAILKNRSVGFGGKLKAAMLLAWIRRVESGATVQFSSLSIAGVRMLHLPGEPFVQFQLAAQKALPNQFVAVAGYRECAMWYLGEDRIYTDRGGYEQSWAFTGPCEKLMKQTIIKLGE